MLALLFMTKIMNFTCRCISMSPSTITVILNYKLHPTTQSHLLLSLHHSIVISRETVSLRRESRTKLLRNRRQRCSIFLPGNLHQKLEQLKPTTSF